MVRFLLLIFTLTTIMMSCGSENVREYKVLRYNQPNHITSLDPAFAKSQNNIWSVLHLFDGLVELDDSLNVSPAIAKQWSISDDGLTYTFHLRDDVYFHENECFDIGKRKVVASDFEYSLSRLVDPVFKKWIANQALFLNRNDDYFKGPSKLDGIKTSFMADKKIAMLELLNGNIDFVNGLESAFINELLDKDGNLLEKKKGELKLSKSPYLNSEYLGINLEACPENSPLRIKEVRQAMNYAIDRKLMLVALRNNVGRPADSGFVPNGLPSHNKLAVPGYNYDIQKAKSLLAEAGFPDGKGLEPIELYTNKDYLDITTFVARQLQKIGLSFCFTMRLLDFILQS